ncbi:VOC family protein [Nocardia sp. NPDC005978]|uniref:VOC family protein n=1 Tax=unclassified Nocardia TaxID=2637762 RepID=UPI0033B6A221
MTAVNPYLVFNGNAEEAFVFYRSVLGGELQIARFGDMGGTDDFPAEFRDKIANVTLPLGDSLLMGSDVPPGQTVNTANPGYSVSLDVDSAAEAERVFTALSAGGDVAMPLGKTEWAESFGMVTDKFSVPWMVNYAPR